MSGAVHTPGNSELPERLPVAWIDKVGDLHHSSGKPILFLEVANFTKDGRFLDRSIVWEGRDLNEGCKQWLARKNATDRITLNGYYMGELVREQDLEWRYGEPQASARCPICWEDTPHRHTPEEEAEQREWIAENARRNDARWEEIEAKVAALEAKYPPRTPLYTLETATEISTLKAQAEALAEALASIDVWLSDTLSGRVNPDPATYRQWLVEGVREARNRARKALSAYRGEAA